MVRGNAEDTVIVFCEAIIQQFCVLMKLCRYQHCFDGCN